MARFIDAARRCLPVSAWPPLDQSLWQQALTASGDPEDDRQGSAVTWRKTTTQTNREGYGRWINFLIRSGCDLKDAPAERVTPARVRRYLLELRDQQISMRTRSNRIAQLLSVMLAFSPERDWTWLKRRFCRLDALAKDDRQYKTPALLTSEASVRRETITVESITDRMGDAANRVSVIILDACRNNPFEIPLRDGSRGLTTGPERRSRGGSRGLAAIDAARGTLIAYATAPGSVAADGEGANGLYTEELLKTIKEPGLKVEEVFKRVRARVAARTDGQQIPWESSSLTGDLVFNITVDAQPAAPSGGQR